MSPADNTVKEAHEEAGRNITVKSVIAVQRREKHNKPQYAYGVVKIFYLCSDLGGEFCENSETTEAKFFAREDLPRLTEEKCNKEQVLMCFKANSDKNWVTLFD